MKKTRGEAGVAQAERRGTLFAAGLIVGESLIGVIMAMLIVISVTQWGTDAPASVSFISGQLGFTSIVDFMASSTAETLTKLLGFAGFIICLITFAKRMLRK